jgi:hypothetical protein
MIVSHTFVSDKNYALAGIRKSFESASWCKGDAGEGERCEDCQIVMAQPEGLAEGVRVYGRVRD